MNLLLVMLKTGQTLVSLSEELDYEPKCHLIEPHELTGKTKLTLTPWPPHTDETNILLHSDSLLTVIEPTLDIANQYLKKIGKTMEDLQTKDNRVLLNEDENVPGTPPPMPEEDDYEPYYMETE
jgi:hypothetical protein